jgi:diadenosine tetraphosphate (Ap4A) HIT family hydrolase
VSSLDRLWAGWRSEYIESVSGLPEEEEREGCVFCAILASGRPDAETHVLWRHPGGDAFALLNAFPYCSGHLMVMPTRHVSDLEALTPAESRAVWDGIGQAVRALKAAYRPDGLNMGANLGRAAGAGIPGHFHLHVLPRWGGDTNFMTAVADTRVLPEALAASAAKLRAAWPAGDRPSLDNPNG